MMISEAFWALPQRNHEDKHYFSGRFRRVRNFWQQRRRELVEFFGRCGVRARRP